MADLPQTIGEGPPRVDCFEKSIEIAHSAGRLFEIRRSSSFLLLIAFVIIYATEVYYLNSTAPSWTFYLGGPCSAFYLLVILVSIHRQRRFHIHVLRRTCGVTRQKIHVASEGLTVEEVAGARHYFPWTLFDRFLVNERELTFVSSSVLHVAICRKFLTEAETAIIRRLAEPKIVPPDNYPTIRKLFRR